MHRLNHASYILCVILLCTVFMLVMMTESLWACHVAHTGVEGSQLIQQHSDVPERYCTFSIAIVVPIPPLEHWCHHWFSFYATCAWEAIKEKIFFSFVNVATVELSSQNQSDSYGWVGRCAVCAARGKLPHPPVLLCKNCNEFFCQSCFSKVSYSCTHSSDTSWLLTTAVKQGSEQMINNCSSFVVHSFILPHAWRVI